MRISRRNVVLLTLFVTIFSFPAISQIPALEWQYTQNYQDVDRITNVTPTSDGGYIIVTAVTTLYGESLSGYNMYVSKINSSGTHVWTRSDLESYGYSLFPTFAPVELANGNILVRGDWYRFHYLNGTTGATISTTTFDLTYQPWVAGFAQLANGKVGVFGSAYVTDNSQYKLRVYDANMTSYVDYFYGGSGNETGVGITTSLDGTYFVLAGISSSPASAIKTEATVGGWVLAVDGSGNYLWDYSTPNNITGIKQYPSKWATAFNVFNDPAIVKRSKVMTGRTGGSSDSQISDYLLIGTKASKVWLAAGDIFKGAGLETTFSSSVLKSLSLTNDGRILISTADSVALLNGKFDRIWKSTTYKGLGVEFTPNESMIVYGENDTRLRKVAQPMMITGDNFIFNGMVREVPYTYPPLKYVNGAFLDLDNNGQLDYYALANDQYTWSADATNYSNLYMAGYLTNNAGVYSIAQATPTFFSQWDNSPPTNWTFNDFDRDNSIEAFFNDFNASATAYEEIKNIVPATGVMSVQAVTGLPKLNLAKHSGTQWADFNNDGMLDVFIHNDALYLQGPVNTFSKVSSTTIFASDIASALALDINNDTYVDLIDRTGKAIWLNSSTTTFTKHGVNFTHTPVFPIELNGDGFIDFIGNNGATWYTFINNGSMTFTYTALGLSNPAPAGDINNDGRTDIVAAQTSTGTNPSYYVYFNSGTGSFNPTINYEYMVPSSYGQKPAVTPGNYDNDGDLDLAIVDDHQVLFLKNRQTSTNAAPSVPGSPASVRNGAVVTLSWAASTDDTTPANALNYNVYIKNGSTVIVNSLSNITNGKRLVLNPGNTGFAKQFKINNLPVGTYQWGVQAIDKGLTPSTFTTEQTLYVTNNPTNIALSGATIAENSTANIGTLTTTDPDGGETFTYSLVTGTGDTDNALFKITTNALSAQGTGLNFETKSSYSIRIRTTDSRQGFFEKVFAITATDVQEIATQITLTPSSIAENQPVGTTVGTLGNNDPDGSENFTYTLVAGTGDTDNAAFEIATNTLKTKQIFNFETKTSYSVRVQVKDKTNNLFAAALVISITDVNDFDKPSFTIPTASVTQAAFSITWDAIEGATSYEIEISATDFPDVLAGYPKTVTATSLDVTGLQSGIVHKVRLRAAKGTDKSGYSDVVLQITVPPDPLVKDPLATSFDNFTAAWGASTGASSYELEVSIGTGAFTPMAGFNPRSVSQALDFAVEGLDEKTTYKYRVRAVNSAGKSGNSNEKSVTTTTAPVQANPLKIETLPSVTTLNADATSQLITIRLSGGEGAKTVTLSYRGIMNASPNFTNVNMTLKSGSETDFETTIAANKLDELGLEYYAEAEDDKTTATQASHSFIYRAVTAATGTSIPFASGFDGTAGTYQMFSIPYELADNDIDKMFDGPLNGPDKTQWRLLHYLASGTLQEYPTSLKEIKPGEGYWFNTIVSDFHITLGVAKVVQVNQTTSFPLQLQKGWNQIGNPYPFDLNWSAIIAGNDKVGSLNTFSNGGYTKPTTFKMWAGAFVHATETTTLNIPVTSKANGRVAAGPGDDIDSDSWELPLFVSAPGVSQQSGIGMNPDASLSKDRFDDITVPRFLNFIELNTHHNEFFAHSFSTDVVPVADSYEWTFTVRSNIDKDKDISWDNSMLRNAESSLILIDLHDRTWVDMKATNHYSFTGEPNRQVKIIYTRKGEIHPGITLLGQSYPNPFNESVSIPVLAEKAGNTITVEVLDMLGRRVKTIAVTPDKSGPQVIQWDGRESSGSTISNGMYFYRVTGESGSVDVKRMIKN